MFIKLADIHVQEGFNKRVDDERTQAADDDLFNHLSSGKPVPPLEVRPRDDGGVWIVEGHRRHRAYLRCRDAGKPVEWIAILPFTGSDVERIARIMNSNSQLSLPLTSNRGSSKNWLKRQPRPSGAHNSPTRQRSGTRPITKRATAISRGLSPGSISAIAQ